MLAIDAPAGPLPRPVRRALEAINADLERHWSVADLAQVANVSGRTLQRQFTVFLGKALKAVILDLRMDHARRRLLQGQPDTRIMDVALSCGFPHLGRFAMAYRRRYDEMPSQTQKRQALLAGTLVASSGFSASPRFRPSIALGSIDAAPENSEAARHIADEIATALMRAGAAVASLPGSAQYHLGGSLRGAGTLQQLSLRLVDGSTGCHLWAHRCDGNCSNDQFLATRIVAALQPRLRLAEIDRAIRKPDVDLGSYDLTLRAMPGVTSLDVQGNRQALDLLNRAIEIDPGNALATALAAWAHAQRVVYHFTATPREDRARGISLAHKAMTLSADVTVLAVLGNALTLLHELETADAIIHKALAVDGSSAWAWSRSGWIHLYRGDAQSAIERFRIALDLAPQDSFAFNSMVGIGCAHFEAGRYLESAHWQERALVEHPSAVWVHRTLCPAYMLANATPKALRSLAALRGEYRALTIAEVQLCLPPLTQNYRDRAVGALQDAGLPN